MGRHEREAKLKERLDDVEKDRTRLIALVQERDVELQRAAEANEQLTQRLTTVSGRLKTTTDHCRRLNYKLNAAEITVAKMYLNTELDLNLDDLEPDESSEYIY